MTASERGDANVAESKAAARERPKSQGPSDLTLSFIDEATVRGTAGAAADPDWLLADRLVGLRAFGTLPIETNPLYTTYVDLRNARLADVRPCTGPAAVVTGAARTKLLPDGAAAYAEIGEDRVSALVLSAEARAAGVILETLADLQARDPGLFRQLLDGGCALPENDKLAQMTRALWSQGLLLHVPNGVRLERPVVLRWKVGAPGKALFSRTVISLGEDAEVSVVEEQVASGSAERSDASEAQAFFAGTTEAVVGAGSSLSFAGLQNLSLRQIAFQHRSAVLGRGATVRWALAQLGCRVVRSRIDNRLDGDGSTVEQADPPSAGQPGLPGDVLQRRPHPGEAHWGNPPPGLADRRRAADSYVGHATRSATDGRVRSLPCSAPPRPRLAGR